MDNNLVVIDDFVNFDDYVDHLHDVFVNVNIDIDINVKLDIDIHLFDDHGVMNHVSIIYTHWAQNPERSTMMYSSLESLLQTAGGSQIIVCDNGGNDMDSHYLLGLCIQGMVASYTRYRHNMHLGYARNDALSRATGQYIVITDNDVEFKDGWLEECVQWLEATPGKYLATPLSPDPMNQVRSVRWAGEANGWRLNTRAGSNAFVMKRETVQELGRFQENSTITGCRYNDKWIHAGYLMGVMPEPKAVDLGLRMGNNWKTFTFQPL